MDVTDRATEQEERKAAVANAMGKPARDLEAEICNGCNYATRAAWGKTCDGYRECLEDLQRRERAAR